MARYLVERGASSLTQPISKLVPAIIIYCEGVAQFKSTVIIRLSKSTLVIDTTYGFTFYMQKYDNDVNVYTLDGWAAYELDKLKADEIMSIFGGLLGIVYLLLTSIDNAFVLFVKMLVT